ncbi:MAG: AgmX/PglI C-terminal domain-containing protein [Myxococcales bacterium]|nr:AgmX/PglI C-terminal domain-containing protein [Myxococcales bacterium]
MRLHALAFILVAGCSSSEVTTTITSSSGSAAKPAPSPAKSGSAATPSASAATPVASASAAPALRDAEAELKTIDPFDDAATDGGQRLLNAMVLCGQPGSDAPWGKDDAVGEDKPAASRCSAQTHAKLYMKSVSMLANGKGNDATKLAEADAALALALDPAAALPAGASPAANAVVTAVKKRPAPSVRVGAVTATNMATTEVETAVATELSPAVRFCYTHSLTSNPKLEGTAAVEADLGPDGRLAAVKVTGTIPDESLMRCVASFAKRSKLSPPSSTPAKVAIPFTMTPGK